MLNLVKDRKNRHYCHVFTTLEHSSDESRLSPIPTGGELKFQMYEIDTHQQWNTNVIRRRYEALSKEVG